MLAVYGERETCLGPMLQWPGVKKSSNKSLEKVIYKEGSYFRPYIYTPWGIHEVQLLEKITKRSP